MASSFARWSIEMGVGHVLSSTTRGEGSGERTRREEAKQHIVLATGTKKMMKVSTSFGTRTALRRRSREATTMSYVSTGFFLAVGNTGRDRLTIAGLHLSQR